MNVSDGVGEAVGAQKSAGALRPVHADQSVFAHQHLAHVLSSSHPDQWTAQKMCFEHVTILLPARGMESRTLYQGQMNRTEEREREKTFSLEIVVH